MEFRLLGPVEVWSEGRQVPLGGAKPRTLLTALLLDHGRVVSTERLMEAVWGAESPPTARAVLHTYVASLRRSFKKAGLPDLIVSHSAGYLAEVPAGALDRDVFEAHLAEGRRAAADGRHRNACDSFQAALRLWRGPALGGIGESFLQAEAARLDELRLTVVEERIASELALGHGPRLVEELEDLVSRNPVRERLRRDLMVALYQAGRRADALTVFRTGRRVLIDELGIEPGAELVEAHEAILRGDRDLLGAPGAAARRPRQLPAVPADFTGREAEVAALRAALTPAGAMPICVISGAGGSGKSALALRVAQQVAAFYPDGQVHVELRGTSDSPATPEEVLGRLLRELDGATPPPATLEERIASYLTLLAGQRRLVVLDDAASERQVRPLLPGGPGCAVLITSRNRLVGLAGAGFTDLGVLPEEDAVALLARVAGAERVAAAPEASRRLVRQCGGLPLAIRIAGARLASRRLWPIQRLTDRLADEHRRLDELSVGDQEVRANIGLSYDVLTPVARTMLRRLGLLGLPHFPVWVAAVATDTGQEEAEQLLEQLVDASLVEMDGFDALGRPRYRLHDLIRLYARERARAEEDAREQVEIVTRVLGGWLWLVERATEAVPSVAIPMRTSYRLARPLDDELASEVIRNSHAWFTTEEEALIVGVELAAAMDLDEIAVELAAALSHSAFGGHQHLLENPFATWNRTHEAALVVARRMGNALGEATLLAGLGQLRYEQDRFAESRSYLSQALSLFRAAGEPRGEATTLAALGAACREQGYLLESLHFLGRARELWAGLNDPAALGYVQRLTGSVHLERGDYEAAMSELIQALAAYRHAGNRPGQGLVLRTMSLYHRARGELDSAESLAEQAMAVFAELGDRLLQAYCVRALAKARMRQGRYEEARPALEETLRELNRLHDRFGQACTLRTLGELYLAQGRLYEAKKYLEESLELWDQLDTMLFRARTLRDLAMTHAQLGDAAVAEQLKAEAMEIFRGHGSRECGEPWPL